MYLYLNVWSQLTIVLDLNGDIYPLQAELGEFINYESGIENLLPLAPLLFLFLSYRVVFQIPKLYAHD